MNVPNATVYVQAVVISVIANDATLSNWRGGGGVPTPILGRLILTKKGNLAIFMTTTPSSDKMVESIVMRDCNPPFQKL